MELNAVVEDRINLALRQYKKLSAQKRYIEAHESLQKVAVNINWHKQSQSWKVCRGIICSWAKIAKTLQKSQKAVDYLRTAENILNLWPNQRAKLHRLNSSWMIYHSWAYYHQLHQNGHQAIKYLISALKLYSDVQNLKDMTSLRLLTKAKLNLSAILMSRGQFSEAKDYAQQSLKHVQIGTSEKMGDFEEGKLKGKTQRQFRGLMTSMVVAHYDIGAAEEAMEQLQEAKLAYQKAVELGQKHLKEGHIVTNNAVQALEDVDNKMDIIQRHKTLLKFVKQHPEDPKPTVGFTEANALPPVQSESQIQTKEPEANSQRGSTKFSSPNSRWSSVTDLLQRSPTNDEKYKAIRNERKRINRNIRLQLWPKTFIPKSKSPRTVSTTRHKFRKQNAYGIDGKYYTPHQLEILAQQRDKQAFWGVDDYYKHTINKMFDVQQDMYFLNQGNNDVAKEDEQQRLITNKLRLRKHGKSASLPEQDLKKIKDQIQRMKVSAEQEKKQAFIQAQSKKSASAIAAKNVAKLAVKNMQATIASDEEVPQRLFFKPPGGWEIVIAEPIIESVETEPNVVKSPYQKAKEGIENMCEDKLIELRNINKRISSKKDLISRPFSSLPTSTRQARRKYFRKKQINAHNYPQVKSLASSTQKSSKGILRRRITLSNIKGEEKVDVNTLIGIINRKKEDRQKYHEDKTRKILRTPTVFQSAALLFATSSASLSII